MQVRSRGLLITLGTLSVLFGLLLVSADSLIVRDMGAVGAQLSSLRNRVSDEISYWAVKNGDARAREEAVNQLTNQTVLKKVAETDRMDTVIRAAISRITNQDYLFELATTGRFDTIQDKATEEITNQDYLSELARAEDSLPFSVRIRAASRLSDQSSLIEVAESVTESSVLRIVVSRITDEEILIKVAKGDALSTIRMDAVRRINDVDSLIEIAQQNVEFEYVDERLSRSPYPYRVQLEAASRAQCLSGKQRDADHECIENCSENECSVLTLMVL
ncbi:MAG: hypothetical protein V3R81_07200, partial [Gammaproteobacteria bacterium]